MESPKRRFVLKIEAGGDTLEDAVRLALDLARKARDGGRVITGGYSCGGMAEIDENPDMTQEKYHQKLDEYLAAQPA